MGHCWEEYMWKVHKAVPVDPWATNVHLLDVFLQERSPSLWLPSWLHKYQAPMSRVGSMLSLGIKHSSNQKVVANAPSGGAAIDTNGAAIQQLDATTLIQPQSSMPDIQASIRSSTSLLASITGGSTSSAQFDVKGSKTVSCNVGGVKSQGVDLDALMEMVTASASGGLPALWQPDISLPQLQWCSKRGQTLWVVTEIMYANMIKIEGDQQEQANTKVKVSKGVEGEASGQVGAEKEGVWTVTASKDNPIFPFALRLKRLNYDAFGSLVTTKSKESLKRNNSFTRKIIRQLSSKHVDALYRSSSVSRILP